MGSGVFSGDYDTARRKFREAAREAQATLQKYPLDVAGSEGQELTIDVATIGEPNDGSVLVISSGTHGVEGFFGSAVQTAWLQSCREGFGLRRNAAMVLVHAVNPYGFSWLRRVNEDNVDLNRNFLAPGEKYEGAPSGYSELNAFLNPATPPSTWEPFRIKAFWKILRHRMPAMKSAVAVGQYDFPKGLFFDGRQPAQSTRIVQEQFPEWIGEASNIAHIDLHTDLARRLTTGRWCASHPTDRRSPGTANTTGRGILSRSALPRPPGERPTPSGASWETGWRRAFASGDTATWSRNLARTRSCAFWR